MTTEEWFALHPLGSLNRDGYLVVSYCDVGSGALNSAPLHRLVAKSYLRVPQVLRGLHVHHRDGDKMNNHPSNLLFPLTAREHQMLHHFHRLDGWRSRAILAEHRVWELERQIELFSTPR